ncbi:phage baseplate plug family protein [Avibacterium paragallinarum]|uniref:phage baseplate plug family protein n=1 Tax=Avibacterium paragallinarum TaxID=728 RepID=UPI0021F70A6C|nr:hypothetical protein [Avibacterium paragallinarum]UXN37575.1 hypothetical protein N8E87_03640 [Avibacterium paragallinarum]
MWYQLPITNAPYQEQVFDFNGVKIKLTLRYNSIGQCWVMDVSEPINQRTICEGMALAIGVPLLHRTSQPYQFWLMELSKTHLDPTTVEDLANRCQLFIEAKYETVRTAMET